MEGKTTEKIVTRTKELRTEAKITDKNVDVLMKGSIDDEFGFATPSSSTELTTCPTGVKMELPSLPLLKELQKTSKNPYPR
jgi:hypothetical protein